MNDAPENDTMPIQLVRKGRTINLRLRKPVARADEARRPDQRILSQQLQEGQAPPQPIPGQQPNQPVGGGGDNILGGNFFGGQSGGQTGGTSERAVAELFRVNGPQQQGAQSTAGRLGRRQGRTVPDPNNLAGAVEADIQGQGAGGARVGLAGLRDDASGMLVMIDVGGLEAGNYLVGIDDPGMIGAPSNVGGAPATTPQRSAQGFEPTVTPNPASTRRVEPHNASPRTGPNRGRGGGARPNSGQQGQQQLVPRTVLAQVIDAGQSGGAGGAVSDGAAGTASPAAAQTPPTGQAQPLDTPNTGQVGPLDTPATGDAPQPIGDGLQPTDQTQVGLDDGTGSAGTGGTGIGAGPAIPVGTLTVDQSGTGRLQQTVEGMQVRAVVGQAIVIYTQGVPANNTLPPNLDAGAGAAGQAAPGGARRFRGNTPTTAQGRGVPNDAVTQGTTPATGNQMQPVAAGIIRLLSDAPPTTGAETGQQPGAVETGQQPAASLPTTEQDLR
jgi:hypothetical protein